MNLAGDGRKRQIRFNAFAMNCIGHQSSGLWAHPRDRSSDYVKLGYWTELAKTLERGKFDGIFLADVLGVYDVYGGGPEAALRNGAQIPANDPMLLVPAMALVTEHLGFGVTGNLSYEPPFTFARRMSTLDHLTQGRVGWNIVTGYLDSAAKSSGETRQRAHDDRYEVAEEYMQIVYALWEGSWADDAVRRDRKAHVYTDPDRVRPVVHQGRHYQLDAIHLCEPSPQRTPVLYQAGTSAKGKDFAARHAECVFVSGPSERVIAPRVADLRRLAIAQGRSSDSLRIFSLMTIVLGSTEADAQAKYADYRAYAREEGALTLVSGWTGVDLSQLALDDEVRHVATEAGRTALENITRADPTRVWTVREVAEHVAIGGIGPVVVGTPEQVADALEDWMAKTDVDGFNLALAIAPETFVDIVDHLVPELQRRGRYKSDYPPGTLREKLFGQGPRLPANHIATSYRFPPTSKAAE